MTTLSCLFCRVAATTQHARALQQNNEETIEQKLNVKEIKIVKKQDKKLHTPTGKGAYTHIIYDRNNLLRGSCCASIARTKETIDTTTYL